MKCVTRHVCVKIYVVYLLFVNGVCWRYRITTVELLAVGDGREASCALVGWTLKLIFETFQINSYPFISWLVVLQRVNIFDAIGRLLHSSMSVLGKYVTYVRLWYWR